MPVIRIALILIPTLMLPVTARASSDWTMTFRQFQDPSETQRIDCASPTCTGTITVLARGARRQIDVAAARNGDDVRVAFDDPAAKASYGWTAKQPLEVRIGRGGRGSKVITLLDARVTGSDDEREDLVQRRHPDAASLAVIIEDRG